MMQLRDLQMLRRLTKSSMPQFVKYRYMYPIMCGEVFDKTIIENHATCPHSYKFLIKQPNPENHGHVWPPAGLPWAEEWAKQHNAWLRLHVGSVRYAKSLSIQYSVNIFKKTLSITQSTMLGYVYT